MNPFIVNQDFHLRLVDVYKRSISKSKGKTTEVTEKFFVEEQKSITVYKPGNNEVFTNLLFKVMSKNARDLYLYIIATLGEDRDIVSLPMKDISELLEFKKSTYYNVIQELKDIAIIADYKKQDYWINPYFFFRGDRISYYQEQCPDCIKIVAKQDIGDSWLKTPED